MHTHSRVLTAGSLLLSLPTLAAAQGGDDCTVPTPINAAGAYVYDSTGASSSGFDGNGAAPCAPNANPFESDLFWVFTPAAAGVFNVETCGGATYDTQISVHLGADCTAVCLDYNDQSCGNQSLITFAATAATDYLIQAGGWSTVGSGTEGPGILTITAAPPPPANDTCATPDPIAGEGTFLFDNTSATSSGFNGGEFASNGIHPCFPHDSQTGLEQEIARDLFYVWTAPCSGDFQIDTEGTTGITDTKINIHTGVDCGALCYQGDDDDGTGLLSMVVLTGVTAGDQFLIQVGTYTGGNAPGAGQLNIASLSGGCPTSGTNIVCDPALPHYLGGIATLASSSLGAATGSGLHLECTGGPADEFGFFMVSSSANATTQIFNGVLCLDLPAGRYNPNVAVNQANPELNSLGQFDASGVLQSIVGTAPSTGGSGFDVPAELPFSPAGSLISTGDTYYFQCWYRDQEPPLPNPGSTANFSNVLEVLF